MSGNANRSLTDRIRMASNRTNYWYKLQLEEERRVHPDNVTRPILSDPSEERTLYERMGSLAIYRDGVLYLAAPALPVDTSGEIPPTPEIIWWVTNFVNFSNGYNVAGLTNAAINSTNVLNNNYMIRFFTYANNPSYLYDRNGTLIKDLSPSSSGSAPESLLTFTSKDGNSIKLLHFKGAFNGIYRLPTFSFSNSCITPRIIVTPTRTYSALFYASFNNNPSTNKLQILDTSDNIIGQITNDVSGGASTRFDSALIITDENGNYITNASMRTRDLSDNNPGNSIAIRGMNKFSDGSVILAGDFNTQQIVFYNAADVSMGQLTIPNRKTSGGNNNRDIFMAAFDTNGALRYYNYIRSTNMSNASNEYEASIAIDSNNNAYIVGTFINQYTDPPGTSLIQFFDKNKSLISPSSNIVYDTSGYTFNGDPINTCNFNSPTIFIAKYDYNGNFQWFAPIGSIAPDNNGDVPYDIKSTTTGIIFSMLYGNTSGQSLILYQGKSPAQRNTAGVFSRQLPFLGSSYFNNVIIKYDFNGNVAWVKQVRGDIFYSLPPGVAGSSGPTNIGHPIPLLTDTSNNIYNVSSCQGGPTYQTVSLWDIGSSSNTQITNNLFPSSGSNPYIVSLTDSGNLRWYGLMSAAAGGGIYCYNSALTNKNELVLLCNHFSNNTFTLYNPAGETIYNASVNINVSSQGEPHLSIFKIASDGTIPGTDVKYIVSKASQITSVFNIRINNALTVDSSNNVYVTGEFYSATPAIGQSIDLVNQDGNTVATITKRSALNIEYFTVKIPASFTQE